MAYLHHNKNKDNLNIAVINCAKKDIKSRFELVHLFKKHNLSLQDLIFKDEIDLLECSKKENFSVTLLDHNKLSTSDQFLQTHIQEIIDHHED
jgi:inorganic pyrophosphatase/exopolyphosphatase